MNILESWGLAPDLTIARVDKIDEIEFRNFANEILGQQHPFLMWNEHLTDEQVAKYKTLKAVYEKQFLIFLVVLHKGEMVGLSTAHQFTATEMMMSMSAIAPEFRGRGLYSELAKKVLSISKEAGFQMVVSKHRMTNNPILIAKLKLGFKIYGMEVHPIHGTLIKMVYAHNELMEKSLRFRAGEFFLFDEEEIHEYYGGPFP